MESEHNTSIHDGIRHKLAFVQGVFEFVCENLKKKRDRAKDWAQEDQAITPGAHRVYDEQLKRIGGYIAETVSDDIVHVCSSLHRLIYKRRVVVSTRQCSCGYMEQYGIPCRRFICALNAVKMVDSVFEYFDSCYTTQADAAAFDSKYVLPPIQQELVEAELLPPELPAVRPGPAVIRQIASRGETATSKHNRVPCLKCGIRARHEELSKHNICRLGLT